MSTIHKILVKQENGKPKRKMSTGYKCGTHMKGNPNT